MQLFLTSGGHQPDDLRRVYAEAIRDATNIYIASAYLTDWSRDQPRPRACKELVFIVGTDFGLTRKAAMRDVLGWMPKRGSYSFLAAPRTPGGGFHPKILAWRSKDGRCYALTGSSNLSKAAFGGNYEANALSSITAAQLRSVERWLEPLIARCTPVTEDWIDHHYTEASIKAHAGAARSLPPPVKLALPVGSTYERVVRERRKQQAAFAKIKARLSVELRRCASGKIGRAVFWARFWALWSRHESRFQGSGLQFSGKSANWRQACSALVTILDTAKSATQQRALDAIVGREIDHLARLGNPARGAWLSEMLCHYFPTLYPVWNSPVTKWLKANRWRGRRGSSEGQRYVELARQLRHSIEGRPAGARNLAELDYAIWHWVHNRQL
jgi:hypothetical protein